MSALDDLIAAVEAPDTNWYHFPELCENAFGECARTESIRSAYMGSLDAGLGLHEALLPGTSQYSIVTDPTCLCVKVAWWPKGLCGGVEIQGEGWDEGNPARAWLLAILRALKSQEGRE